MAGFLSMLPGLFGRAMLGKEKISDLTSEDKDKAAGNLLGIFDTVKGAIGNVLSDVGSGNVNSWGDFGKSLARSGAKALGVDVPHGDAKVGSSLAINQKVLDDSNSANNGTTMIVPNHPRNGAHIPYVSTYKAPEVPMAAPANMVGQHEDIAPVKAPRRPRKAAGKRKHKSLYKK